MTSPVPALTESELPGVLEGSVPPGVYRCVSALTPAHVTQLLTDAGNARWQPARLPLAGVHGKSAFLDRCASDLQLPSWFGRNWDALADCLTDLSWWDEPAGYLIVATDWDDFASAAPQDAATAVDILTVAAGYWSARATPLTTLLA